MSLEQLTGLGYMALWMIYGLVDEAFRTPVHLTWGGLAILFLMVMSVVKAVTRTVTEAVAGVQQEVEKITDHLLLKDDDDDDELTPYDARLPERDHV
jgi:hypothetical protein